MLMISYSHQDKDRIREADKRWGITPLILIHGVGRGERDKDKSLVNTFLNDQL